MLMKRLRPFARQPVKVHPRVLVPDTLQMGALRRSHFSPFGLPMFTTQRMHPWFRVTELNTYVSPDFSFRPHKTQVTATPPRTAP